MIGKYYVPGFETENLESYLRMKGLRKWTDYNNYDIMLGSSILRTDGCVAVLKGLLSS